MLFRSVSQSRYRCSVGRRLERYPFSGLVHSAGELLIMFVGVVGLATAPTILITIPAVGIAAFSQTIVNSISLAQISHDASPSMRRMMLQTGIQAVVGATSILLISVSLHANAGWRLPIILGAFVLTPISLYTIWRVKFIAPRCRYTNQ